MEESRKISVITLMLLIIFIIVVCIIIYFFVDSNQAEKELEDAKNTISSNLDKINELTDQIKKNDELAAEAAEIAKKQVGKFVPFDSTKCLNKEEGMEYEVGAVSSEYATMTIKDGKVYIELTNEYMKQYLAEGNPMKLEMYEEYEVKGFIKNVIDVGIYSVGHSNDNTVILFLMEDGTVEVLPLIKIRLDGIKTLGKIDGVEKVVRIINGVATSEISGYLSPFAIAENGGFYNLAKCINEQGFYE